MENNYEVMETVNQLALVTKENSQNTAIILKSLDSYNKMFVSVANSITNVNDKIDKLDSRIDNLEQNEEITTEQSERIRSCAQMRISEILGDDPLDRKKYYRIFIQHLYHDTRAYAGLGSKIDRTRKSNFQSCINYIEAWLPNCGISELKNRADNNAKANREAKNLDYIL